MAYFWPLTPGRLVCGFSRLPSLSQRSHLNQGTVRPRDPTCLTRLQGSFRNPALQTISLLLAPSRSGHSEGLTLVNPTAENNQPTPGPCTAARNPTLQPTEATFAVGRLPVPRGRLVCVCVCEVALATGFPAGEAPRRVLAGSPLRAPALPTRGCRPPRAPQAVPRAGSAAAPHPGHQYLPASFLPTESRTPRAPRHATAGRLTLPAAAAPPPSRPVGAPGWRWEPLGVRLIPPCPAYLGGQAAGAAGSRRRCEQEARGGSAAALHGGSSPALRLGGSGAAPRDAGRPVAATSAGATPVRGAPPSALGPGSAAS